MLKKDNELYFRLSLMNWNKKSNTRTMPWKGEKDPYKIWLSEVILQQTRVEQGWDYYNKFIKSFPTVSDLAKASETKLFKMWEGLGYYSRCKNLIHTAKFIHQNHKGIFPRKYEDVIALKGIGEYTAAAIVSFAYNDQHAVVDGNVYRVLARFFGIALPIDQPAGKQHFKALATTLLDKKNPGIYNQALMDFGATVCKPKGAVCDECPLQKKCTAYQSNKVEQLPVKSKQLLKRERHLYYFMVNNNNKVFIKKREKKDIWQNLYEFILIEETAPRDLKYLLKKLSKEIGIVITEKEITDESKHYTQQLTHQTIKGKFFMADIKKTVKLESYSAIPIAKINSYPYPKFITTYLKDKMYL